LQVENAESTTTQQRESIALHGNGPEAEKKENNSSGIIQGAHD
jgi:hypothetical protein